jgi:subtilase family serine protease
MPLVGASLVLSRTPAQQKALNQLAAAQQNPASPLYHRWLTPEQYAAQFGVAAADIAAVTTWLEQQGFTVSPVARSRNRIFFSGTAGQVANAFGAPLRYYRAQSEATPRFAPSTNLTIPASLSSVVQSVQNISSFRPHPQMVMSPAQPMFTTSGSQVPHLTPFDVDTVYDVNPVLKSGYNGAGQTIAIAGQSAVDAQDLANFQTALGVPVNPQSLNLIPNTGSSVILSGDEAEGDLDLEYSSAMAPGATVAFYYVGSSRAYNAFDAINYVVDNDLASIISFSFAMCEPDAGAAFISSTDAVLEQAAVQGQTVLVASGDY